MCQPLKLRLDALRDLKPLRDPNLVQKILWL